MRDGIAILEATPDHVVATFHHVVITLFARETRPAIEVPIRKAMESLEGRYPGKLVLLSTVAEGAPLPGPEARAALAEAMRAGGNRVQRSALHFEGNGFRAAAVRGVTTGLILVARQPYPHQVFKSLEEAAAWVAPEIDTRELLGAVDAVRDSLLPRSVGR